MRSMIDSGLTRTLEKADERFLLLIAEAELAIHDPGDAVVVADRRVRGRLETGLAHKHPTSSPPDNATRAPNLTKLHPQTIKLPVTL
jgi:hypothetical protein